MKIFSHLSLSLVIVFFSLLILNCKKQESLTIPIITTTTVTSITATEALFGGDVTSDGGSEVTDYGVCVKKGRNPTTSDNKFSVGVGMGSFSLKISGFDPKTTYYVRAYAINKLGTAYGNEESFTTAEVSYGTITDIEGNVYKTLSIGSQIWMAENLKTTKYTDGSVIENVTDDAAWSVLTTGAYCWFNNDDLFHKDTYGALYNWYAITTDKLCPAGWYVPSEPDWTTLIDYLGGEAIAGGKLKEVGTTHWWSPNTVANTQSGFNALPGGRRNVDGTFWGDEIAGYWWTSTFLLGGPTQKYLGYDFSYIDWTVFGSKSGISIRCIKSR